VVRIVGNDGTRIDIREGPLGNLIADGSVGNDGTQFDIYEGPLGNLIAGHQDDQASSLSITPSTTSMVINLYHGMMDKEGTDGEHVPNDGSDF
nr:hypothetical protein [Tanacetum cinerariifolium]